MRWRRVASAVLVASAASWTIARSDPPEAATEPPARVVTPEELEARLRAIGRSLLEASPKADPGDARARDAAAENLGRIAWLIDAADEHVPWGVYDAEQDTAVERCAATRVNPMVMAKVYLSMFTFGGDATVRIAGDRMVLEVGAKFRDRLNSGEYPYPLWSTPEQWESYTRATGIAFVFEGESLVGVMRRLGTREDSSARRTWNGQWEWTDLRGRAQPRVAQFAAVLSQENPEIVRLQSAYAAMSVKLRAFNCLGCHSPETAHGGRLVTLLGYPNEALAARESLAAVLNSAPTHEGHGVREGGIPDEASREHLAGLAASFAEAAESALFYEAARRATPTSVVPGP